VPKVVAIEKKNSNTELPPVGEKVMVQCEGYRGLAYRDSRGVWKSVIGNKPVPTVIEFFPI
jgi:GH24 family phage-related lysozyme (muramidase)